MRRFRSLVAQWFDYLRLATVAVALTAASACDSGPSASKAEDHLVAAAKAIASGDDETALAELTSSIDKSPSAWAYFERARIHAEQGRDVDARADCERGLELDPEHRGLQWLATELEKPNAERFQGPLANPPRATK